jgi:hypothetical protein
MDVIGFQHAGEKMAERVIPDLAEEGAGMAETGYRDGDVSGGAAGGFLEAGGFTDADAMFERHEID